MARCYTGPPRVPAFNLTVNVWVNFAGLWVYPPLVPFTYASLAQLQLGERVYNPGTLVAVAFILFPKGTDVHFNRGAFGVDYVECPAGSGRVYSVIDVDDVGRGFANEYRQALVTKVPPYPVPWP